jgi:hypothetical protein
MEEQGLVESGSRTLLAQLHVLRLNDRDYVGDEENLSL